MSRDIVGTPRLFIMFAPLHVIEITMKYLWVSNQVPEEHSYIHVLSVPCCLCCPTEGFWCLLATHTEHGRLNRLEWMPRLIWVFTGRTGQFVVPDLFKEMRGDIVFTFHGSPLTLDTLCAQLLLQFYANLFETLQVFLSWSEDVHVVWI